MGSSQSSGLSLNKVSGGKAERKGEDKKTSSASVRARSVSLGTNLPIAGQSLWVKDILLYAKGTYYVVSAGSQVRAGPQQVNSFVQIWLKREIVKLDKSEEYREIFTTRTNSSRAWFSVGGLDWIPPEHKRDIGDCLASFLTQLESVSYICISNLIS